MARLTSNSDTEKEGFVHPLSMDLSQPLESSIRSSEATYDNSSRDCDRSMRVNNVELRDSAIQTFGGEVNEMESDIQAQSDLHAARGESKQQPSERVRTSSSTFAIKHKQLSQLPRSVRWRLCLGLLTNPSEGEDVKNEDNTDSTVGAERNPTCMQQDNGSSNLTSELKAIEEVNALKLRFQRSRYEELVMRHYWSHTPMGITGKVENKSYDAGKTETTAITHVPKGDDPLSALVDNIQEDKGSLFGFGGKRRAKRAPTICNSSIHDKSIKSSTFTDKKDHNQNSKTHDEKGDKSKWADFYSTREMLDVIEKDLNRLPSDHYTVYHKWRKCCTQWKEENNMGEKKERSSNFDFRPSTIIQKPSPRPLRQRFGQSLYLGHERNLLSTVENEEEENETKITETTEKLEIQTSTKERAEKLSQLLFVYGQEHGNIGYRQGMHEILSYILLSLEIDLMEYVVAKERKKWRMDLLSPLAASDHDENENAVNNGVMAGVDESGKIVVIRLLDPDYILHDAFALFECVMDALASSYDVVQTDVDGASAGCLEGMTSSIVSKIRYIARDEALFSHILYMPVPPQLYFAKWVRLMFSREVAGGMIEVMGLWDAFFELAFATASIEKDLSLSKALMNVLKTAAAAMILLIRHLLLAPTLAWDGSLTGDPDPNDGIQYLMNYPSIQDTGVFVKTITSLLAKEKLLTTQYDQSKKSSQRVKAHRYQRMSSDLPPVAINNETQTDNRTKTGHIMEDRGEILSRCSSLNGQIIDCPSTADAVKVCHANINGTSKQDSPRRRSLSNTSLHVDESERALDSNASIATNSSRISSSRSFLESSNQQSVVMANKLERSLATLMQHFNNQLSAQADVNVMPTNIGDHSPISHQSLTIPEVIWHAMADIDQVRKDLLSQSVMGNIEKTPSSSPLSKALGDDENIK